jgi:hypothetical protein
MIIISNNFQYLLATKALFTQQFLMTNNKEVGYVLVSRF